MGGSDELAVEVVGAERLAAAVGEDEFARVESALSGFGELELVVAAWLFGGVAL